MPRWNGKSKKQDKRTRDGFEEVYSCEKCGADIFYSHEMKKLLEPRTRYYHSDLRCKTIQQTRKVAQHEKNAKSLRPSVIQELRSEIRSWFDTGKSLYEILFEIMIRRKFEIDQVSTRELAAAFYPSEVLRDLSGELQPTYTAIKRILSLLRSLRKNPYNQTTLVYSKKFKNGEWYYYNLQTKEEYQQVEKRLIKQKNGIIDTMQKNVEILQAGPKERKKREEEFRKAMEFRRRKKSPTGGGGIA